MPLEWSVWDALLLWVWMVKCEQTEYVTWQCHWNGRCEMLYSYEYEWWNANRQNMLPDDATGMVCERRFTPFEYEWWNMNTQNTVPGKTTGMVCERCFTPVSMNGETWADRIHYLTMPLEWSVRDALLLWVWMVRLKQTEESGALATDFPFPLRNMEMPALAQVKLEPNSDAVDYTSGHNSITAAGIPGILHSMQEAMKGRAFRHAAQENGSHSNAKMSWHKSMENDLGSVQLHAHPVKVLPEVKVEIDVAETMCPLMQRGDETQDSDSGSETNQPQDLSLPKVPAPVVEPTPQMCVAIKQEPDTSSYECEAQSQTEASGAAHRFKIKLKLADIKTEPKSISSVPNALETTHLGSFGHAEPAVDGVQVSVESREGSCQRGAAGGARRKHAAETDEEDMESLQVYFPCNSKSGVELSERCQVPSSNLVLTPTSTTKLYQCSLCLEAFEKPLQLKNHMMWHNTSSTERPLRCGACAKVFRYCSDLMQHTVVHTGERNHKCEECQATFTKASSLKEHTKTHTGERPFKCDQCSAEFKHSSHLKAHKRVHTGEKPYQCDICRVHFTSASYLKLHRKIHTGERRFKCDQCTAEFNQALHLETHKRIHTGEKPFRCELCSLTYRYKSSLKSHIYKAHCLVKPYKCEACPAAFNALEVLRKHAKSHEATRKPFRCEECSAEFLSSAGLSQHKWTHTGEKPFKCGMCPAAFRDATTLKRHKVIHTGERPFKCNRCCASFKLMTHLSCHTKIHGEEKLSENPVQS